MSHPSRSEDFKSTWVQSNDNGTNLTTILPTIWTATKKDVDDKTVVIASGSTLDKAIVSGGAFEKAEYGQLWVISGKPLICLGSKVSGVYNHLLTATPGGFSALVLSSVALESNESGLSQLWDAQGENWQATCKLELPGIGFPYQEQTGLMSGLVTRTFRADCEMKTILADGQQFRIRLMAGIRRLYLTAVGHESDSPTGDVGTQTKSSLANPHEITPAQAEAGTEFADAGTQTISTTESLAALESRFPSVGTQTDSGARGTGVASGTGVLGTHPAQVKRPTASKGTSIDLVGGSREWIGSFEPLSSPPLTQEILAHSEAHAIVYMGTRSGPIPTGSRCHFSDTKWDPKRFYTEEHCDLSTEELTSVGNIIKDLQSYAAPMRAEIEEVGTDVSGLPSNDGQKSKSTSRKQLSELEKEIDQWKKILRKSCRLAAC
ncbi:MAG: hypothetical protein TREMPRED_003137 [Tremellales sp. Tagirdzhanova-0007]|nr:MAG: hypothetical protein TREMPRED_003137 [Tremellales sp. Tagirdzhanova-0007]